jgi:hypothetical protein
MELYKRIDPPVPPLVRLTLIMSGIVLGVFAWIIVDLARDDQAVEPETAKTAGLIEPVEEFLAFAAGTPGHEVPAIGLGHEYTAEGLLRLAAAIESLAGDPPTVSTRQQLSALRNHATRLRDDPTWVEHAGMARAAFTSAAALLTDATGSDADDLRRAAEAIDPDRQLLDQMDRIRRGFDLAADHLRRHTRGRADRKGLLAHTGAA